MALVPARGNWTMRRFDSNSTATFTYGSLVALNPQRKLVEYTSVSSAAVGIAAHDSVNSLPAGKCTVHVPSGGDCTFYAQTGALALSSLSLGQYVGIKKSGNTVDQVDATLTSAVSAIGGIYSITPDTSSAVTRIEVYWAPTQWVFGSASTTTFAS